MKDHGQFAYVEGGLAGGDRWPLLRLRYGGSASTWGFGLYLASSGKYENQILSAGTPEEALDCACGLYLDRWPNINPKELTAQTNERRFSAES